MHRIGQMRAGFTLTVCKHNCKLILNGVRIVRSGSDDERSDRVLPRAMMRRLRHASVDVRQILKVNTLLGMCWNTLLSSNRRAATPRPVQSIDTHVTERRTKSMHARTLATVARWSNEWSAIKYSCVTINAPLAKSTCNNGPRARH